MMPSKTLGFVHTSATLVPVFQELAGTYLDASIETFHLSDDSLIKDVIRRNELTPLTAKRVGQHIASAEEAGADFILVTCSSIGRAVEAAAEKAKIPVLRVDQPMADAAVDIGNRIGVVATLPTTLDPTADLIRRRAQLAGSEVVITERLCEGAFAALMSGDTATHDDAVATALRELSEQCDVIVLAQASMARVADALPAEEKPVPVLSSPALAVQHLATLL
jgi:Asp/Glu/hydantoin racemase